MYDAVGLAVAQMLGVGVIDGGTVGGMHEGQKGFVGCAKGLGINLKNPKHLIRPMQGVVL